MKHDFGRHVYGAAAIMFGVVTLLWHDLHGWEQSRALGNATFREAVVYVAAIIQMVGGITIQWRRTAQLGATMLGVVYLFFALFWVPRIIEAPKIYDRWANFFEQFAIFLGALIVYPTLVSRDSPWASRAAKLGRILFGICVVSFTIEQAAHLDVTASLVPKWIPPSPMFWAMTTTVAFALAAIAILSGRQALLASRLLTAMLLLFGLLIWLPAVFAHPHSHFNWSENAENLAIAAGAWILADYLGRAT